MRKITNLYKKYGFTNIFWSKTLFNDTMILIIFFNLIILPLYLALIGFYQDIIELFIIYK